MSGKRILFLSARVGTGHMSAALAVKEALSELAPDVESTVVDTYRYASAFFGKLATDGYIQLVRFIPLLYNLIYEYREKDPAVTLFKNRFTEITAENLKPFVESLSPEAIVCTHAFPSGVASLLKEELGIPVINIVTDFTVHPFWIHANVDLYVVGNGQLAEELIKKGIAQDKIKPTGIPVDSRFGPAADTAEKIRIRKTLGLAPHLDTVLVMGGGVGLGPIGWILRSLSKVKHPIQVAIVTGTNRRLKRRMDRHAARLNSRAAQGGSIRLVRVYGYVNNVYDFMKAADLLISKAGGLTSNEALVAELPMVIAGPLPGPETRNAQYLVKEKVAVLVRKGRNVSKYADLFFSEPARLRKFKEQARLLKKPDAARDAAAGILEILRNRIGAERSRSNRESRFHGF